MAYSATELMQKANHIYEIDEVSPFRQFLGLVGWTVEALAILWFVLYVL